MVQDKTDDVPVDIPKWQIEEVSKNAHQALAGSEGEQKTDVLCL